MKAKQRQALKPPAPDDQPAPAAPPAPPLRLEWIEAGSLAENPANWRRHSKEQLATIGDLLGDPEVGWAGACLFNERTGRLVDGHARKAVVDPRTVIPVLVGSWSEDAERKILATLDPVASMAVGDQAAYAALVEAARIDSLWVRDLIDVTLATSEPDEEAAGDDPAPPGVGDMELRPFEHYDYVIVLARTTQDWEALVERLGLQRANSSPIPGKSKVGLCRAVDAARLLELMVPRA